MSVNLNYHAPTKEEKERRKKERDRIIKTKFGGNVEAYVLWKWGKQLERF